MSLLRSLNVDFTPLQAELLSCSMLALLTHLWYKLYESTSLLSLLVLFGILPTIPVYVLGPTETKSPEVSIIISYLCFISVLLLSVVIYRLSPLHPLYKYPGPVICRVSKFWMVYIASQGKINEYFLRMHRKYGPIMRVGPNELSIVDETLLPNIMGLNGMPKGPMWDGRRIAGKRGVGTTGALIGARDRKQHTESRQVWNRAFTSASVKLYEPIVIRRAAQLVEELKKRCVVSAKRKQEAHVDMSRWMSYFSFDFMGDFVFGGAFELMRDGDEHGLIHTLESGLFLPSLTQHNPWCIDLFIYMPFLGRQMKSLGGLAYRQVQKRLKEGSVNDDLFYHLNDEAHVNSSGPPPLPVLITNSVTAVIAGSDTTASTLSNIVYLLSRYPSCLSRLRAEVDTAFPPGKAEPTESVKLAQMEYLNAVINEALRLYPPVASCLQRAPTKGSGGQMLGTSLFVSEDTAVYAPPYAYHRDPRYFFPDPDRFWPERWLNETRKDKGVVLNVNAFMPFSIGPANCVGKPLALLELRIVISYMVQNFDMRFADGYREDQWEDDLRDYFVTQRGSLPIVLNVRMPPA